MPEVAPTISEITTRISAMASAMRRPVTMKGEAAGSTTLARMVGPEQPNVRAVRISTGSTPRTPSMVLMRIGNEQARKITNTFIPSPMPSSTMATGTIAGAGTARRNSTRISPASWTRRQ